MLCFKSPLTNVSGKSRVGGDFGPDLKKAGFDYVVFEGRAPKPVYVVIEDQKVTIHQASHLLGRTVSEKTASSVRSWAIKRLACCVLVRREKNWSRLRQSCQKIGQRGAAEEEQFGGRRILIAVAVKGSRKVEAAQPDRLKKILHDAFGEIKDNPMFVGLRPRNDWRSPGK